MPRDLKPGQLHVEVKHHSPLPECYTWQIHCLGQELPVCESQGEYCSWEEASQADREALRKWLPS